MSNPSKDPKFNAALQRVLKAPLTTNADLKTAPKAKAKRVKTPKPWPWAKR